MISFGYSQEERRYEMNKSCVFCCCVLIMGTFSIAVSVNAQKLTRKEVPTSVSSTFEKSYPNAIVRSLSKENRNGETVYEIESMDGKIRRDIIYSADGTALEIEERISPADLPDTVKQAIDKEYPKGKVKSAERLTKGTSIEYEIIIGKGKKNLEVVFDEKGKVLRTAKP
jgi:hypothetical protein